MASIQSLANIAADRWPVLLTSILAFLVAMVIPKLVRGNPVANIPLVGEEMGSDEKRRQAYMVNAKALYAVGYQKFRDGLFRVVTMRQKPVIVLPPKYLLEIGKLPDDVLDTYSAMKEGMQAKYTKFEVPLPGLAHTIKTKLTPGLARFNPIIAEEIQEAFLRELPPCRDWTPINVNQVLLRVVATASGRVFIGPELSRNEQYLDAAINYTIEMMGAQKAVSAIAPWKRPWVASQSDPVKRLDRRLKEATEFLRPVVEARVKLSPEGHEADDMLQWVIDTQLKFGSLSIEKMAKYQLILSFASIHTTSATTLNALYSLAVMPEIVPELREEVRSVLAENNNTFTSVALQNMKKLDSFLNETVRFHGKASSFIRDVVKPFTLSDGQRIPAGVCIEVPAHAISYDNNVFPDAHKFDAFRFSKMRQAAKDSGATEAAAQNQFVSSSPTSFLWGYGRHACAGRFFAASEVKIIMAHILVTYDIKNVEGQDGRIPNMEFGSQCIPDPTKMLLFKKIA